MNATTSASYLDTYDRATEVASQLTAMLNHTYGGSREAFHTMGEDHKDAYLWACARLAEKLEGLIGDLGKAKP